MYSCRRSTSVCTSRVRRADSSASRSSDAILKASRARVASSSATSFLRRNFARAISRASGNDTASRAPLPAVRISVCVSDEMSSLIASSRRLLSSALASSSAIHLETTSTSRSRSATVARSSASSSSSHSAMTDGMSSGSSTGFRLRSRSISKGTRSRDEGSASKRAETSPKCLSFPDMRIGSPFSVSLRDRSSPRSDAASRGRVAFTVMP
mmetsp:Transcript_870/g.3451  ORF Transcript_870/g.3451 Transcript_870/m.3451 type:complete len:211 (-) Transcript_870:47-679(-)